MNKVFVFSLSSIVSHSSESWMTVLKDIGVKIKECCLSLDCLESISIVNDGSIGKLIPINLNSFMVNTAKQESSTQMVKV